MSLIKVTSEELQTLSGQVRHGSESIESELRRMEGEVNNVVNEGWQGAASSEFHALWEEWQRSAQGLKEALEGIGRLLGEAGSHYQSTEEAVRSSMA